MLLFNFVCVFYLMVLIDSHTISKSIAEYNFNDKSDSLTDIDYTRGRRNRHDVFLHKYRREEEEGVTAPSGSKKTVVESTTVTHTKKTPKILGKTKAFHKFWRKFKMKNKKDKYDRMKRHKRKRITISPKSRYPYRITAHKNYRLSEDAKRKREASIFVTAKLNRNHRKDKKIEIRATKTPFTTRSTTLTSTTYEKTLSDITTTLAGLKIKYGMNKYGLMPKLNKVFYEYRPYSDTKTLTSQSTTEETEFPGTAQIEELLNDIKARAIEMIAEQSPGITEILTNAATEATFEADPILTHVGVTSPGFALTTFVTLSNMDDINKQTINDPNMVVISDKDSHNISVRSYKQEAFTIAQNVEDMLQSQLKKIYKKVKCKVSNQYQQEMKTVRSTLADEKKKIISKIDKVTKGATVDNKSKISPCKETKKSTTHKLIKTRGGRSGNNIKKMKKITTEPTSMDDLAMLTVYEQILSKAHEDNVMKMLTTNPFIKLTAGRLFKRKPTSDTPNVPNWYDDTSFGEVEIDNVTSKNTSRDTEDNAMTSTTTDHIEDTSYEGLVDKISFHDYVNGYKHYLNFQKAQGATNFSNLVKFQAHKHHKVDDIGKFILNKIPKLPNRKRRYFFDDSDIDYQDVSTKSDDSWFKKHFYMFIDNGPPKKYHTSETVNFKDVTGGKSYKVGYVSSTLADGVVATEARRIATDEQDSDHINLDELSNSLEDRKQSVFYPVDRVHYLMPMKPKVPVRDRLEEGGLSFKICAPNYFSKWFGGKEGQNQKKPVNNIGDTFFDSDRLRRDTNLLNLLNKTSDLELRSTMHAAPPTVRPKAINKQKDGYVSIEVVSQPTSIVKLRSNTKQSKLKNLLNKLHITRNKKKQKRQARGYRFNPFKKLKDIFKNNEDDRGVGISRSYENDYEIMNSHIDTFKPIKYNSILSMEDLRNQIPNITQYFGAPDDENVRTTGMNNNKEKITGAEHAKKTQFTKPDTKTKIYESHNQLQILRKIPPRTYTNQKEAPTLSLTPSLDDIMNVNIKTTNQIEKPVQQTKSLYHMSLQEIKNEIEKLNKRIYSHDTPENPYMMLAQTFNNIPSYLKKSKSQPVNKKHEKIPIMINRNDFKSQRVSETKKPYIGKESIDIQDNINIKSIRDFPKLNFDEYNNLQEINGEISDRNIVDSGDPSTIALAVANSNKPESKEDKYKIRNDFNDLLLWHGDILNYDSLTSPSWQDIINHLENFPMTTPNLVAMQDELAEINNLLHSNIVYLPKKDCLKNITVEPYNIEYYAKITPSSNHFKRNDYGDGNLKTMTVITEFDENGPNNYYTTRDSSKRNTEKIRSTEDNMETLVRLDTTVLSYDDSVDSITESPMKITRNYPKATKSKNKSSVKTRTNQQPQQSFSTPFPMTMNQFELFLKQNDLDVESVTAPIVQAPNLIDIYHGKPNSNASEQEKAKNIPNKHVSEIEDDLDPEDQIEYLNQELDYLENDLDYINNDRRKKYYQEEITKTPEKDKEVEITIINLDDANKLFEDLNTLKDKFKDDEKSSTTGHFYSTHKIKGTNKIMKINEDPPNKTITTLSTTDTDDDGRSINVHGHSFHYNLRFGPHKQHKVNRNTHTDNKSNKIKMNSRTYSEGDFESRDDRRVKEKEEVHRFGREAKTTCCKSTNVETTNHSAASQTPDLGRASPQLWVKFIPILQHKLSLFSKKSKSNTTKGRSNSTLRGKEKSNSNIKHDNKWKSHLTHDKKWNNKLKQKKPAQIPKHAMTKVMMSTHKAGAKNEKMFPEVETDKYNDEKDVTSPLPSVMTTDKRKSTTKAKANNKAVIKDDSIYLEVVPPDDQVYYELGLKKLPLNLKVDNTNIHETITNPYTLIHEFKDVKSKRNAIQTFTAKNVAAIEVVVDLFKNNFGVPKATSPVAYNIEDMIDATTTNSIQVHIAVPYGVDDKKRSVDLQRVRKVFSAKMGTPVDLEYQINSVEDVNSTPSGDDLGLSPGMYLVVDNITGRFSLKPVKNDNRLLLRDVEREPTNTNFSSKVTLSKDFLTAINHQLLKLYENLTSNINNHKIVSRNAHWDKIKRLFGRDKLRNCKCKANRTMCRVCADSDQVVKELTIAFENLSKYMMDHCPEIQTFFWMNPKGGKQLRDIVSRIDKSLTDHYKKIKGKCQERPCKTFSTYLDKRGVNKSLDELNEFLDCMRELSANIEMVLKSLPYNDSLKDAGEKFVEVTNSCVKYVDRRRSETKNKYSLDNINVNIICDTDAQTQSSLKDIEFTFDPTESSTNNDDKYEKHHKKILGKIFSDAKNRPKNKLFTYYVSDVTPKMDKRETFDSQLESPLIADAGGSFWQDYIGKNNDLNRLASRDNKRKTKATTIVDEETKVKKTSSTKHCKSFKDKLRDLYPSKLFPTPTPKLTHTEHNVTQVPNNPAVEVTADAVTVTHEESLSHNINELMKIFEKVYHFENYKTDNLTELTLHKKTTKHKSTKAMKIQKTTTVKMHEKAKSNKHTEVHAETKKGEEKGFDIILKSEQNNCLTKMISLQSKTTTATIAADEALKPTITVKIEPRLKTTETIEPEKKSLLNKLKQVTAGFFNDIKYKTSTNIPKHHREADKSMTQINNQQKTQVISAKNNKPTTKCNKETSINALLFLQQINDNQTETTVPSDMNIEPSPIDVESTPEMTSLIYKINDGQQHTISEQTTENAVLIVSPKVDEVKPFKNLFRSILEFENKSKKREYDDTTLMDIEDIMMTYTDLNRRTTTKKRKKQKTRGRSKVKSHTKKHKDKHTVKHKYTTTPDLEYDVINELKTLELQLPSPTDMKENQKGTYGFSIQIVPNTEHKKHKGSTPS